MQIFYKGNHLTTVEYELEPSGDVVKVFTPFAVKYIDGVEFVAILDERNPKYPKFVCKANLKAKK
jgi:hypothetical protein